MSSSIFDQLSRYPVIAAVKSEAQLDAALESNSALIFLLTGSIFNLQELVEKIHGSGKRAFVHIDLVEGFSRDDVSLKYIHQQIRPDGFITTRPSLAKKAVAMAAFAIRRVFVFDSLSMETAVESIRGSRVDAVEVLPGTIPKTIRRIVEETKVPLIAGGLFEDKRDVIEALKAGALGISTSNRLLWKL